MRAAFAPYPWRAYAPRDLVEQAEPESFLNQFIVSRIEAFLEVHPVYRDERRNLTLAFVNPGAGGTSSRASKALTRKADKSKTLPLEQLPRFEVQLFAGDDGLNAQRPDRLGAELDLFMTRSRRAARPTGETRNSMRRLTYTKAPMSQWVQNPGAFAHIAFIQDYFRPTKEQHYGSQSQPTTSYVSGLAVDLERNATVQENDVVFASGVWFPLAEPANRS